MMIKNYRDENEEEILNHGKEAINHSFSELISEYDDKVNLLMEKAEKNKGFIGNLFQYAYYGVEVNSDKNPDFVTAGIELKVAAYRRNKDNTLSADQRLVLSSIDFSDYTDGKPLKDSSLIKKCQRMLMFYYLLEESTTDRLKCTVDYMFDYKMFSIPKDDLKMIEADYNKIVGKIMNGKAHLISEADTSYLSACRRDGNEVSYFIGDKELKALPRRFAFKNSYITYLLNDYIEPDRPCDAPKRKLTKTKDIKITRGKTFEEYVDKEIKKYVGKSANSIAKRKNISYAGFSSSKDLNKYSRLALKIFGINSNSAPYLKKSATTIKAIRISRTNHIDQSISFPAFKFKEIVNENEWIDSKTYDYLSERRFLFIVFKENDKGEYILKGYKFYYVPVEELDTYYKEVWEKTKRLLIDGFEIKKEKKAGKIIYTNPLPGMSENGVCHIRPHSTESAYKFSNGETVGDWKKYANEMPDGQWMTTQSFWINNTHLMKILSEYMN